MLLVLHFKLSAQIDKCDTIYWNKNRKLKWSDFKALPKTNSAFQAVTASGIAYTTQQLGDTLTIEVLSRFYSCKSWTKSGSSTMLKHEQLHFDIAEYFKRLFIQKVISAHLSRQNAYAEIKKMFEAINKSLNDFEDRYDQETNFSKNQVKQDSWSNKVKMRLDKLTTTDKKRIRIFLRI
jgi:hypothetical protein